MTTSLRQRAGRLGSLSLGAAMLSACNHLPAPAGLVPVDPALTAQLRPAPATVATLLVKRNAQEANYESQPQVFARKYGVTLRAHPLNAIGVDVFTLAPGRDPLALQAQMATDPGVAFAELPQAMRLAPCKPAKLATAGKPLAGTDPLRAQQYGLGQIGAEAAWAVTSGSVHTVVAIVDTGVDAAHPELTGKVLPGYGTLAATPPWQDDHGHGTFVAGLIAAQIGNGTGIAGLAPQVSLLPVKVLDAKGEGTDADVATGIVWAASHGADVIALSVALDRPSQVVEAAVAYALQRNVVVVAAATESSSGIAAYPGVVGVGALGRKGQPLADYTGVSVFAPGEGIVSTLPTRTVTVNKVFGLPKSYGSLTGAGASLPWVAGLSALVKSRWPKLTPAQVKSKLEAAADARPPSGGEGSGHGRINAQRTLAGT